MTDLTSVFSRQSRLESPSCDRSASRVSRDTIIPTYTISITGDEGVGKSEFIASFIGRPNSSGKKVRVTTDKGDCYVILVENGESFDRRIALWDCSRPETILSALQKRREYSGPTMLVGNKTDLVSDDDKEVYSCLLMSTVNGQAEARYIISCLLLDLDFAHTKIKNVSVYESTKREKIEKVIDALYSLLRDMDDNDRRISVIEDYIREEVHTGDLHIDL